MIIIISVVATGVISSYHLTIVIPTFFTILIKKLTSEYTKIRDILMEIPLYYHFIPIICSFGWWFRTCIL